VHHCVGVDPVCSTAGVVHAAVAPDGVQDPLRPTRIRLPEYERNTDRTSQDNACSSML
jgi:hypothetical protein